MASYPRIAREWHGGEHQPVYELELDDQDLPDHLIACGELVSLTYGLPTGDHRTLTFEEGSEAFLAFDPESEHGRLYLVLPEETEEEARDALWTGRGVGPIDEVADQIGGRQQDDYPDLGVQPLGPIVQVEYAARKYGAFEADGGAIFHHEFEAAFPWLGVDELGRLWVLGGDYIGSDPRGIVG